MADHPLRPAIDRRLGELLPHQLANQTQAPPKADCSFQIASYGVLAKISPSCPPLWGRFLRVTHPSATASEEAVRLACIRHTVSVSPEPGSNSP